MVVAAPWEHVLCRNQNTSYTTQLAALFCPRFVRTLPGQRLRATAPLLAKRLESAMAESTLARLDLRMLKHSFPIKQGENKRTPCYLLIFQKKKKSQNMHVHTSVKTKVLFVNLPPVGSKLGAVFVAVLLVQRQGLRPIGLRNCVSHGGHIHYSASNHRACLRGSFQARRQQA